MKQYNIDQLIGNINSYIEQLAYSREPLGLYAPIEYVLDLGGKRLRPVLMLLAYNLYREDIEQIYSQAAGIETYHNFTLLHDDLMDNADMRRGMPVVHKKWNENTAILSGDAMLMLSYQFMMNECPQECVKEVMEVFGKTALEICEGQQYDMEFEDRDDVEVEEYIEMIRLKTSVLLAGSLKIGAVLGGAPVADAEKLYDFGVKMGLAFQLQDDFLDVYGDPEVFGKKIGGDILCNKKTYMLINAMKLTQGEDKAELMRWIDAKEFDKKEKIAAVTAIYNKVDIAALCQNRINKYFEEGLALLNEVDVDDSRKENLRQFVAKLMDRKL